MEGEPSTELIVNHLELGEISGRIGVKGPADGSAWFSNFTYNTATPELPTAPMEESPSPGIIQDWEITQPMVNSKIDPNQYYSALGDLQWMPVEAGPSGLVVLDREVARNPVQPGWLFARTTFRSGEPRNHLFHLGYSDFITVFINGTAVFNGTNAYQSRDPGFQGLIGFFDGLLLPLKKGENEITLLIGEQFGGWGFMMRDGEALKIDPALTKKWELRNKLNYPESVVYDPVTEMLYVSNYLEGSQEYISQVSLDGKIINREWITGLTRPTGLCLSNGKLYAAERTGIVVIDPVKGQIIKRITLNDCGFPNDISATKDGTLYVSDGMKNRIYEVTNDQASILLESVELKNINGLHIDGDRLLAGCSGDASLKSIDLRTKQVTPLARLHPGAILDGLQTIDDGRILFSDFNGHLFILDKPGTYREVLNTTTIQRNLADFVWIPEKQLLVIPGLDSNTLTCWKVSGLK
jgi:outer membrane protein assembly factor BamB